MEQNWTAGELRKFDRITEKMSSRDQMRRIEGRSEIREFIAKHAKEKCDAMFEHLKARDARRGR